MNKNNYIMIVSVMFILSIIIMTCFCDNKNSRSQKKALTPTDTRVIPTNLPINVKPVNTVCQALLHGYRNFNTSNERQNFTPKYMQEVAMSGCDWKPFENIRCENMSSEEGLRSGCDPKYYKDRCGIYQDYVRLISGSDVKPFIYPIQRLINSECDLGFNPYV